MSPGGEIQDGSFESLRPGDHPKGREDEGWELKLMESAIFLNFHLTVTIRLCPSLFYDLKNHFLGISKPEIGGLMPVYTEFKLQPESVWKWQSGEMTMLQGICFPVPRLTPNSLGWFRDASHFLS